MSKYFVCISCLTRCLYGDDLDLVSLRNVGTSYTISMLLTVFRICLFVIVSLLNEREREKKVFIYIFEVKFGRNVYEISANVLMLYIVYNIHLK